RDSRYERPHHSSSEGHRNPFAHREGGNGYGAGSSYGSESSYEYGNGRSRDREYGYNGGGDRRHRGGGRGGHGRGDYDRGHGRGDYDRGHGRGDYDRGYGGGNGRSEYGGYDRNRGGGNGNYERQEDTSNVDWKQQFQDEPKVSQKRSHDSTEESARKRKFIGSEEGSLASPASDSQSTQKNKDDRRRIDRYEIVRTRGDVVDKKGKAGTVIKLKANYFKLEKCPEYEMLAYRVDFDPECEDAPTRKYLMYTQRDLLGAYLYDTANKFYTTHKLQSEEFTVQTKDRKLNNYELRIKQTEILQMDTRESLQVLNLILRRAMEGLQLQLVGRNLFDALGKIQLSQLGLELWPGYTTSIRQHEQSILLSAEITNKVMRRETIYDIMVECSKNRENFRQTFESTVIGTVVLTDYNNKTYRIDDIDFGASPQDTFETKKEGTISYIDYYKRTYQKTIRNVTQPMLISRAKDRERRGGENETISLVPELCRPTGLTESQRNNNNLMRDLASHTRLDPRGRISALRKLNSRLQDTDACQKILTTWNLTLSRNLVEIEGRQLKSENIIFGRSERLFDGSSGGYREPTPGDWSNAFQNKAMYLSYRLENWVVIYWQKMHNQVLYFIEKMIGVALKMGFEIRQPHTISINDDNIQEHLKGLEKAVHRNPQLVLVLVGNNNADKYAAIKKTCTCNYGIPTQIMTNKTLNNKSLTIATKVAIQLNCKLGGTPWLAEIPTRGLMTIGVDISRDKKDRKQFWGALVATMDLKDLRRESFFSCVTGFKEGGDYSSLLVIDIVKAVKEFYKYHGVFPKQIVIFREGVSEGQLKFIYENELAHIKAQLEEIYKANETKLKLVYIITTKKISTRIFSFDERNPPPGTVVDDVITLPESNDFFLCAQTVRQGTVTPTRYNVLYNSSDLTPDRLQQLTYKQCHLYYNWSGTTRVPAVCQNAHKLSAIVAQYLHILPSQALEKKLYFLVTETYLLIAKEEMDMEPVAVTDPKAVTIMETAEAVTMNSDLFLHKYHNMQQRQELTSNVDWKQEFQDQPEASQIRSHDSTEQSTRKIKLCSSEYLGSSPSDSESTLDDRYEVVRTRGDVVDKTGRAGTVIKLKANYFELEKYPEYEMLAYRVDFDPECEYASTRKYLMCSQRKLLGAFLYDTENKFYTTHKLHSEKFTVQTKDRLGNYYELTIKQTEMDARESLHVLNLILRKAMEGSELQLVGRNFYDPGRKIAISKFGLELWPGYATSIRQHEQSILLSADIANKIIPRETIDDIRFVCLRRRENFRETFGNMVLGTIVVTDYNKKTYRIDDIDFAASPQDTFVTKTGMAISYVDYYQQKYRITITNVKQPMLISRAKNRKRRGGEKETISLVPELCRPTGLTEMILRKSNCPCSSYGRIHNSFTVYSLMRDLAIYNRMDPRSRINALRKLNSRLQKTDACQRIFKPWNLKLSRNFVEVEGRQLKTENIIFGHEDCSDGNGKNDSDCASNYEPHIDILRPAEPPYTPYIAIPLVIKGVANSTKKELYLSKLSTNTTASMLEN
ncbi:Protein piwi, partial [Pseudolycoriella hygida]